MEPPLALPAPSEKWGPSGPSQQQQEAKHEKQDKSDGSPAEAPVTSSLEDRSPRGALDLRAFESPQLRHRRTRQFIAHIKGVEKFVPPLEQSQSQPQQLLGGSRGVAGVCTAYDDKDKRVTGKGEAVARSWRHGGDSTGSPAASTAAPTAATAATSPFIISASSPSLPPSPRENARRTETDRRSIRQGQPRAPLMLLREAAKQQAVQEQERLLQQVQHQQQRQWARLFGEAAWKAQQQLHLLQEQLFLHPLLLAAAPSLVLAAVPATGVICILAAGLLPVR